MADPDKPTGFATLSEAVTTLALAENIPVAGFARWLDPKAIAVPVLDPEARADANRRLSKVISLKAERHVGN
jgi:hypothetical protein